MICPKCGSTTVSINESVYTKSKRRSFLWNLLMVCITGGLWLIWMLIRKRKEKTVHVKMAVCQSCANSWKV